MWILVMSWSVNFHFRVDYHWKMMTLTNKQSVILSGTHNTSKYSIFTYTVYTGHDFVK